MFDIHLTGGTKDNPFMIEIADSDLGPLIFNYDINQYDDFEGKVVKSIREWRPNNKDLEKEIKRLKDELKLSDQLMDEVKEALYNSIKEGFDLGDKDEIEKLYNDFLKEAIASLKKKRSRGK